MSAVTFPPDYFRAASVRYSENPTDRVEWLRHQMQKAYASILQYKAELESLQIELVKLGAETGSSGLIATVGGTLALIPAGYTQVIGGVLIVASSFFSKAENKAKNKRFDDIKSIAFDRANEVQQVAKYYNRYKWELLIWHLVPIILILWILKKK